MEDRMEASERIRVLIASAYGPLRSALREMLEHEDIDVVAESASARQVISLAHVLSPQVTVADDRLVDSDAHTLCRKLHEFGTPTRCIIPTSWPVQSTGKPLPGDLSSCSARSPTATCRGLSEQPPKVWAPRHNDPSRPCRANPPNRPGSARGPAHRWPTASCGDTSRVPDGLEIGHNLRLCRSAAGGFGNSSTRQKGESARASSVPTTCCF